MQPVVRTDVTEISCEACSHTNRFDQPHPYHAGFGNQGFLYNDTGDLTLVWSAFDCAYTAIIGEAHPWALSAGPENRLEELLSPAPSGGRFRFANPARCLDCGAPIHGPINAEIHFLLYPNSLDVSDSSEGLSQYLTVVS